jgi:hypothetical protein
VSLNTCRLGRAKSEQSQAQVQIESGLSPGPVIAVAVTREDISV